ncbi:hypothetical protein VNO77_15125 [Canavalia gladiata]|uniref:Uncharacterized protein n=1 Tax=Canavalia gladiata TaxID=3824 RepID=A0AAN9M416_CANGL
MFYRVRVSRLNKHQGWRGAIDTEEREVSNVVDGFGLIGAENFGCVKGGGDYEGLQLIPAWLMMAKARSNGGILCNDAYSKGIWALLVLEKGDHIQEDGEEPAWESFWWLVCGSRLVERLGGFSGASDGLRLAWRLVAHLMAQGLVRLFSGLWLRLTACGWIIFKRKTVPEGTRTRAPSEGSWAVSLTTELSPWLSFGRFELNLNHVFMNAN